MEEPLTDSQIEVEKTPLGIQLTLQFLRLLMVVMIFPLVASGIFAAMSLILGAVLAASVPRALLLSLMGLGSFVLMLMMTTGRRGWSVISTRAMFRLLPHGWQDGPGTRLGS